jgi:hypothetical protein
MEAVMISGKSAAFGRGCRVLLALAMAAIVPACGKTQQNNGPMVVGIFPQGGSVARQVVIYIDFDSPLNPGTVPSGVTLQDNLGAFVSATGAYNSVLNQISITPNVALAGSTTYTVTVLGTIQGADGKGFSGFAFQFTTIAATVAPPNSGQPAFAGLTTATAPATPATINLAWTAATDVPDGDSIKYDVYVSTQSKGEDFSIPPLLTTTSGTGVTVNAANGLLPATTYFFVVRAREATSGNIEFNTVEQSAKTN